MPRPNTHALERSISAMTVGIAKQREADEKEAAPLRLDQTDQVLQVDLEGEATAGIDAWADFTVDFDYVFVYAPTQSGVPYSTPVFTWGFELRSKDPVVVNCYLAEWLTDDPDADPDVSRRITTIGARLRAAAFIPGADVDADPVAYRGVLHLNFGGFAAPYDTPSDDEAI